VGAAVRRGGAVTGVAPELEVPQGRFRLDRPPLERDPTLRAWDAADEYVLHDLAGWGGGLGRVTVVGDGMGALAVALASAGAGRVGSPIHAIGDSWIGHRTTAENLARNGLAATVPWEAPGTAPVHLVASTDAPPPIVDTLVVRVPRSLAALEDQLARLRPSLHAASRVVTASMTRHLHTSTLQVLERSIGPTRTSPARRKARLAWSSVDEAAARPASRWPRRREVALPSLPRPLALVDHPAVFAAGRVDAGTALLLGQLPRWAGRLGAGTTLVDAGCGDGVLALAAAVARPETTVVAVDESYQAVASTSAGAIANGGLDVQVVLGDGLLAPARGSPLGAGSVDVVVTNPPFHAGHAVSDATAWRLFVEARRVLRPGGELWAVGNRHLAHHAKLSRLFGGCEVAASDPAFVVLRARRR